MNDSQISKWDAADYLLSQDEIDEFVQLVMADGDMEEIQSALKVARRAQKKLGLKPLSGSLDGLMKWADSVGLQLRLMAVPKTAGT